MRSKVRRTKKCMIKPSDIFKMTDAFFTADPEDGPGWVCMVANGDGRACIDALFPEAHIDWDVGKEDVLPEDWRAFCFNVPDTAAATEHKLPMDITRGVDLRDATAEALAFLLAHGVNRQGGRSGFQDPDGVVRIFKPHSANN
jgi:hypothetical protein